MKIKPLYIYLGAFVIIISAIILIDSNKESTSTMPQVLDQSEMPQDDIHQNLGSAPGSGNVSGEFKQKMADLKSRFETNPRDTVNAKEYARLLTAAHKPDDALGVYNSILNADPKRSDIRLELATVYYNLQKFSEAKSEIEKVLLQNPNSPDINYNLGAVEAAMGNTDKAKEIWQNLIAEYPNSEAAQVASTSLKSLQ